ncbi:MAG: sugar ABC transporter permease [Methylobacter sp.]|nr:MAG: sugar ABC transporter permease [Methylobacter sp.]PPD05142.1 MAG: sugar ABC transporter permease [Methylobacter sp.]PPD24345.1 MAG: sugar ABC transporter permease [Methylobacter sp.]
MNPHEPQPVSLKSLIVSLVRNRQLILQMTTREVIGRYKGSIMGVMWSFFNPMLLLAVYTFVFSVVFKARWGLGQPENQFQYAMLLFVGMIAHGLMAETLSRAPLLMIQNVSYIKKIVFPLEILPVVSLCTALFHAFISLVVLMLAMLIINGSWQWTFMLLPAVLFPLLMLILGLGWILASLGVFLRDIAQPISLIITLLLFASPVFYPLTALPDYIQPWLMFNPLTLIIEQARAVLIFGLMPDWKSLAIYSAVAATMMWLGYVWFQKTRKGFANVL